VVSLFDLLKFNAHKFVAIIASSATFHGMLKGIIPQGDPRALETSFLPPELVIQIPKTLNDLKRDCDESLLLSASDLIEDLISRSQLPGGGAITLADYFRFDQDLNKRIEHELKRKKFYQLRPEVAAFFDADDPFGQAVSLRFPGSVHDIREACRSFACDRYDATVFHSARALEATLHQFAGMLGIDYSINWGSYIEKIRKVIEGTAAKDQAERAKRDFVSRAATLLQTVQLSWRNESMHVGSQYSSGEAEEILQSTKAFMNGFTEGLQGLEAKGVTL